jgi:hypothetical protein
MFHCPLGTLVSGLVIALPMLSGGRSVRVRGKLMEFRGPLMRFVRHAAPFPLASAS